MGRECHGVRVTFLLSYTVAIYTYIRPSYAYIILQDGIAECSVDKYNKFLIAGMMEFLLDEGFDAGMNLKATFQHLEVNN